MHESDAMVGTYRDASIGTAPNISNLLAAKFHVKIMIFARQSKFEADPPTTSNLVRLWQGEILYVLAKENRAQVLRYIEQQKTAKM